MKAGQGDTLQCFEATESFVNLTAGTYLDKEVAHCAEDGDLLITWLSGNTDTVSMLAGGDLCFDCKSIEVVSGTFHLMNQ